MLVVHQQPYLCNRFDELATRTATQGLANISWDGSLGLHNASANMMCRSSAAHVVDVVVVQAAIFQACQLALGCCGFVAGLLLGGKAGCKSRAKTVKLFVLATHTTVHLVPLPAPLSLHYRRIQRNSAPIQSECIFIIVRSCGHPGSVSYPHTVYRAIIPSSAPACCLSLKASSNRVSTLLLSPCCTVRACDTHGQAATYQKSS